MHRDDTAHLYASAQISAPAAATHASFFFFVNSRRTPVINAVKPHEEEFLQKNQDETIRSATFRHSNVQLSHSTFGDRQEEETHVNAHSYTFTHVNTFITSLIKNKHLSRIQPFKEAYGRTRVQTHTDSNTLTMKEFGLLPILHQSSDIPTVNSTPASVCVCVCERETLTRQRRSNKLQHGCVSVFT